MWQQRHAFLNAFDIQISPIFRVATLPALAWNSGRWRRRATLFCLWWRLTLDEIKIGVHKYITTIFKPSALLSIFPIWSRWWKLRLSTSKKIKLVSRLFLQGATKRINFKKMGSVEDWKMASQTMKILDHLAYTYFFDNLFQWKFISMS